MLLRGELVHGQGVERGGQLEGTDADRAPAHAHHEAPPLLARDLGGVDLVILQEVGWGIGWEWAIGWE